MKWWEVARFEYLRRIRSKWFIISTFGMPILILGVSALSGFLAGSGTTLEVKHYMVIDETGQFGDALVQELDQRYADREESPLDLAVALGSYEDLHLQYDSLVEERTIDGYFVIPGDILETFQLKSYGGSSSSLRMSDVVEAEMEDVLQDFKADALQIPDSTLQQLLVNVHLKFYELGSEESKGTADVIVSYLAPAFFLFLLLMGIFTGAQMLLRAVLEERSSRVIEVLLASMSHQDLMTGKIMGLGMLGITQSAIYLVAAAIASAYFDVDVMNAWTVILYFIYFVLGYLLFASFFIGVGALFDSEQEAQQAISLVSILAILPAMFWMLVLENPDSFLVNVLCYIPFFTPFFMIMKVAVQETSTIQVITTVLVLGTSVLLAMRGAARVFRVGVLLYGKRVTLPEIWRWIRA